MRIPVQPMMKLSYRIACLSVVTVLCLCVLFVLELEVRGTDDAASSGSVHGRQHFVFHRKFLNRDETSKVSGEANPNPVNVIPQPPQANLKRNTSTTLATTQEPRDEFLDLFKYSVHNPSFRQHMEWPPSFRLPTKNPTLSVLLKIPITPNLTNWEKFHLGISKYWLYNENSPDIEPLLHDMATLPITGVEQLPGGTQLKLIITLSNGGKALFKPMRFPRDVETLPNHFYFTDYERHVSEIASYHLDRVLGFRRAPPVIGRVVNITSELYPLCEPELHHTFFVSPAGNVCFHGQCSYYCDTGHAICGNPHMLEGSLAVWLPPRNVFNRVPVRSPWRRSYNKRRKAAWETDDLYCITQVKPFYPYNEGRRIYDVMDLAIFDFLTGNMDRHHYDEIITFGNRTSSILHWDHGRGFGRPYFDEMTCIMPLSQCCVVRLSTFNTLYRFHTGPRRLSEIMRDALKNDPVAPVLTEPHLVALDRRVAKVLDIIRKCLQVNSPDLVFLDDM